MRRGRKFAIVLLAAAVVVAAVYATGAFTSITVSRSVDVQVAGDGSAFLSLQPSEGPNGKYASYGPGGALQVTIGGAAGPSRASGVNPDSTTVFRNVFTITNKGSQPVSVWITDNNPAVTFIQPDGSSLEAKAGAVTIRPGGRSLHVGLVIDSRGVKPGANLLQSVTIHTDADVSGVRLPASAPDGTAPGGSGARTSGDSPESGGRGPPLPVSGGVPGSLGDPRLYSAGNPFGQPLDSEVGCVVTTAVVNIVPVVGAMTDSYIEDCGDSSRSSDDSGDGSDGSSGSSGNSNEDGGGFADKVTRTSTVFACNVVPFGRLACRVAEGRDDVGDIDGVNGPFDDEDGGGGSDAPFGITKQSVMNVGTAVVPGGKIAVWINRNPKKVEDAVMKVAPIFPGGQIGVWAHRHPKKARKVLKGSIYGETGMPGGVAYNPNCNSPLCVSKETASSPYYLIGWMVVGIVPVVDIAADFRDFGQNLASSDYGEAALDAAAIAPIFGKFADIGQLVKYSSNWVSEFPRKADDAIQPIAKHVLPHLKDKHALRLLDIFTHGKASKLHEQGVSVNKIIEYAKNGKFTQVVEAKLSGGTDLGPTSTITRTDSATVIKGRKYGTDVNLRVPDNGKKFYVKNSEDIDSIEDLRHMSPQRLGEVVENDIAPKLIRQQGGEVIYGAKKGGTDPGIDIISKNSKGQYVITEVKFTSQSKTPGKGLLNSYRKTSSGKARQMENRWIRDSFNEEISKGEIANYKEARRAIRAGNYKKKVIIVQDGASEKSITKGLAEVVDEVTIVRTGGVTKNKNK